jgi:16S rRNA A1518/A1519 N6-dimethyltransferase RsmA/KsgA/DIM1 with predicted DNA glycosylase/AP lyase activity
MELRTSKYELGRYETTIRALGGRRFARAFEPGCPIGVLTERLAKICDHVEAMDISPTAVRQAQERCRRLVELPQVARHGLIVNLDMHAQPMHRRKERRDGPALRPSAVVVATY